MEEYVEYISRSPEDTARISAEIATQLRAGDIILYEGDMGAGKTTFTKGLAAALGITDPVTSPTFALVNEYTEGRLPLFHFDLYRIDSYDDLYAIGVPRLPRPRRNHRGGVEREHRRSGAGACRRQLPHHNEDTH